MQSNLEQRSSPTAVRVLRGEGALSSGQKVLCSVPPPVLCMVCGLEWRTELAPSSQECHHLVHEFEGTVCTLQGSSRPPT